MRAADLDLLPSVAETPGPPGMRRVSTIRMDLVMTPSEWVHEASLWA
jgi:hypothetical protein